MDAISYQIDIGDLQAARPASPIMSRSVISDEAYIVVEGGGNGRFLLMDTDNL